jgi:hypothetical protein
MVWLRLWVAVGGVFDSGGDISVGVCISSAILSVDARGTSLFRSTMMGAFRGWRARGSCDRRSGWGSCGVCRNKTDGGATVYMIEVAVCADLRGSARRLSGGREKVRVARLGRERSEGEGRLLAVERGVSE